MDFLDSESINIVGERAYNQHYYENEKKQNTLLINRPGDTPSGDGRWGDLSDNPFAWMYEPNVPIGGAGSGIHDAGAAASGATDKI